MKENISLEFMVEKIVGKGEDSEPIVFSSGSSVVTGVCDGMGGSGAALCTSDYGKAHTKAYVSSRIIRKAIYALISNEDELSKEKLHKVCVDTLRSEVKKYPSTQSMLRSKLIREYPTTLALAKVHSGKEEVVIDSFWAGDSRNYLWTKDGFYQISVDDLVTKNDPLKNLTNDSALSNCICADKDFTIQHLRIKLQQPCVILSATDGCFGYLKTPMHFQHLLERSLHEADSVETWKTALIEHFKKVAGDDFSMALSAVGFDDFNSLKATLGKEVNDSIAYILYLQDKIKSIEQSLKDAESELETRILNAWQVYKPEYMKFTDTDTTIPESKEPPTKSDLEEKPKEEPEEAPKEAVTEDPKEKPEEKPKEEPKVESKDEPKKEPEEAPKEEVTEEPKKKPEEKPKEEPKVESKDEPKEEPEEAPKEDVTEEPKEEPKVESKVESKEEPEEAPKEEVTEEPKKEPEDAPKEERRSLFGRLGFRKFGRPGFRKFGKDTKGK